MKASRQPLARGRLKRMATSDATQKTFIERVSPVRMPSRSPARAAGITPVSRVQHMNKSSSRLHFARRSGHAHRNTAKGRATSMKIATAPINTTAAIPAVAAKNVPPTTRLDPRMRPTPTF